MKSTITLYEALQQNNPPTELVLAHHVTANDTLNKVLKFRTIFVTAPFAAITTKTYFSVYDYTKKDRTEQLVLETESLQHAVNVYNAT